MQDKTAEKLEDTKFDQSNEGQNIEVESKTNELTVVNGENENHIQENVQTNEKVHFLVDRF